MCFIIFSVTLVNYTSKYYYPSFPPFVLDKKENQWNAFGSWEHNNTCRKCEENKNACPSVYFVWFYCVNRSYIIIHFLALFSKRYYIMFITPKTHSAMQIMHFKYLLYTYYIVHNILFVIRLIITSNVRVWYCTGHGHRIVFVGFYFIFLNYARDDSCTFDRTANRYTPSPPLAKLDGAQFYFRLLLFIFCRHCVLPTPKG